MIVIVQCAVSLWTRYGHRTITKLESLLGLLRIDLLVHPRLIPTRDPMATVLQE